MRAQYPVSTGTTFTATMLTNNDTYEFYVKAIGNGGVESAASNVVQAVPRMAPPPAPTNLTATSKTDGTIQLDWGSSGNGIWYWVYSRVAGSGTFTRSKFPVSNGTSMLAAYLVIGQTYEFYVTAFNSGGESPRSNIAQARSTVPPPPAPTLTARSNTDGTISLNWSSAGVGIWYHVYWRDIAGGSFARMQYPVTSGTSLTAAYLKLNHTYEYKVRAFNAGGEGAPSNTVAATSVIPPPTGLTASYGGSNAARLTWDSVNPNAMFYVYVRDTGNSAGYERQIYPVSARTWQIVSPLKPGHTYQFLVTQVGNDGETAPSNVATFLMALPADGACGSVTSNFVGVGDIRRGNWDQVQLYDVTSTVCGVRNGSTITLHASWTTRGNQLLDGAFAYFVVDCETWQIVSPVQYMPYPEGASLTEEYRVYTYTVNPTHHYFVRTWGGGHVLVGGMVTTFASHTLAPMIPFDARSRCF